ncbi:hypothetical protein [Chitinivorax sp. B]|uniref:hypothetical protein n=1 Tax=Chitinivorax sp. B TaxID=2502235 RepID=UPI0014853D61|nr:hypothetical protein [Chitinivorax sp. B]
MKPMMVSKRIIASLNQGVAVVADITPEGEANRRFVHIRTRPKPGIPREERRYLNSRYSMWEYWDYKFQRITLRPGWEAYQWDYDLYLLEKTVAITVTENDFYAQRTAWVPDFTLLKHNADSNCPI